MTSENTYAIEFDDVTYSYGAGAGAGEETDMGTGAPALDGVGLRVRPGEFLAVVGANGSGKSTLAKHVNALLVPDEGLVRVAGYDTRDEAHAIDVRRRAGMVFQNPDNQSVAAIVRDDVAFGPENLGLAPEEVRARVERALAEVGMGDHADDEVHALSGGQKQLVAIAGVLAMEPEILVLDEPGAMLDVRGRRAVMRIVRDQHARGLTVVLVTHFMEDALEADRVVALEAGRVALAGTPAEVFTDADRVRALGLALPFSVELADELRAHGIPVGNGLDEGSLEEDLLRCARDSGILGAFFSVLRKKSPQKPVETDETGPQKSKKREIAPAFSRRTEKNAPKMPESRAQTLVRFDSVGYSYDEKAGAPALRDLGFELEEGEMLGVIGHTGSGKSTLTQLMNALLVPTAGRVTSCGMDTAERKLRRAIRSHVGLVFQYPETQLFATTVAEDVAFGPRNLGLGKDEVERRCREALGRVGLAYDEVAERSPFALSGGQQRRVAIAGVLAMEPEALVLDEPAAGLDPVGIAGTRSLLRSLNGEGTTVVIVSHSMEEVAELCDRVLVLDHGSCLSLGTPAEVFAPENAPRLRGVGLDLPRATAFALELADRGLPLEGPVLTTDQLVAALCDRLQQKAQASHG